MVCRACRLTSNRSPICLSTTGSFAMLQKVVIAGARSGLYGGCIKTSRPSCQRFWRVTTKCVIWRYPDGTQRIYCWPILAISGQSLASNSPVVDSRDLNLVFGYAEATPNE
ncbi:hypothetical protein TNCV_3655831 [Trichonephila clavipes]|nr:hypothetical protein TNCV_3655831 [Trichonephila clavipes]